jgi:hypothetical protein
MQSNMKQDQKKIKKRRKQHGKKGIFVLNNF